VEKEEEEEEETVVAVPAMDKERERERERERKVDECLQIGEKTRLKCAPRLAERDCMEYSRIIERKRGQMKEAFSPGMCSIRYSFDSAD
jgi:hypothetical protein